MAYSIRSDGREPDPEFVTTKAEQKPILNTACVSRILSHPVAYF